MTILFPRIELLRAETSLLQLDQVPEQILLQFQNKAKAIIPDLNAFINQLPSEIAKLCSLNELRQSYSGVCDDKYIIYNFLNTNYNQELKTSLVEFCLSAFRQLVQEHLRYALISSDIPRQYDTQYLIYETENEVDRLSSFAVMTVLAYVQDVDNLYDSELFLRQKSVDMEQLAKTPISRPIKDTQNFIKDKDAQLLHVDSYPLLTEQISVNTNEKAVTAQFLGSSKTENTEISEKQNQQSQQTYNNLSLSIKSQNVLTEESAKNNEAAHHVYNNTQQTQQNYDDEREALKKYYDHLYRSYMADPKLKSTNQKISNLYDRGALLQNTQKMIEEIENERLQLSPGYARQRLEARKAELEAERIQREKELEELQKRQEEEKKRQEYEQQQDRQFNNAAQHLITIMDEMKEQQSISNDEQDNQQSKVRQFINNHPNSVSQLQIHNAIFDQINNKVQIDEEEIQRLKELQKQKSGLIKSKKAALFDNQKLMYPLSEEQVHMLQCQMETKHTTEITLLKQRFNEQIQQIKVNAEEEINKYREEVTKLQILLEQTQIQLKIKEKQYQDQLEKEQFQRSSIHSLIKSTNTEERSFVQSNLQVSSNNSEVSALKKEIQLMKTTNDELNIIIDNQKSRITKLQKDLNESQVRNQQQLKNMSTSQDLQGKHSQHDNELVAKYTKLKEIFLKQQNVIRQQQHQLEQQALIINKQTEKMLGLDAAQSETNESEEQLETQLIQSQHKHIQQLEQELQQKDSEISDLQTQLQNSKSRESFLLKQNKSLQHSMFDEELHKSQDNLEDIEREIDKITDACLNQKGLGSLNEIKKKYVG